MYLFDTDHLGFLQHPGSSEFQNLIKRLGQRSSNEFFVSIVSFHEQVNGWTAHVARNKNTSQLVRGYEKLEGILRDFSTTQLLPFSQDAAEIYEDLKSKRVRVGAMDMRIASIAIANQMTLLTRNAVDFERVPSLAFEDWTVG
jgi:tRNA(fMet)-specific endonuclease VapC